MSRPARLAVRTFRLRCCFCLAAQSALRPSARPAARNAGPFRAKFSATSSLFAFCFLPATTPMQRNAIRSLYFLHGIGENEQVLLNSGGLLMVQDLRDQNRIGDFLIVTPAAGRSFYINSSRRPCEVRGFFHSRVYSLHREPLSNTRGTPLRAASQAFRWAVTARCDLLSNIRRCSPAVSANSAALLQKLPTVKLSDSQETTLARLLGSSFGSPFDRCLLGTREYIHAGA